MAFLWRTNQEEDSFSQPQKQPAWVGKVWAFAWMLFGFVVFVSCLRFDIHEISWKLLNRTGQYSDHSTNLLGDIGLYLAGFTYSIFGWFAWGFAILCVWWGYLKWKNEGKIPRKVLIWSLVLILCGCIFLSVQFLFGQEWESVHGEGSLGGWIGLLVGNMTLDRFISPGWTLLVVGILYMIALIYTVGFSPQSVWVVSKREFHHWNQNRAKNKLNKEYQKQERALKKIRQSISEPVTPAPKKEVKKFVEEEKIPERVVVPISTPEPTPKYVEEPVRVSARPKRSGDSLADLLDDEIMVAGPVKSPSDPAKPSVSRVVAPVVVDAPRVAPERKPIPTRPQEPKYPLPPLSLLHLPEHQSGMSESDKEEMADVQAKIVETLKTFRIDVSPGDMTRGPTVTRYEIYPARGVKVSSLEQYARDIALATKAQKINILAPIPGKDTVGVEIANKKTQSVPLRELLESSAFNSPKMKIPLALGKNIYGETVVGDLASMPHMLVAGTTGSGKSVCINSIIASMLFKFSPEELKLILVDPKVVEMQPYSDLPHLIVPVVTDPKKVPFALKWCVNEMEHRYHCFAKAKVRNFEAYNKRPKEEPASTQEDDMPIDDELIEDIASDFESQGEYPDELDDPIQDELDFDALPDKFPYIVIIIDELADLMQTAPADVEGYIARITQKARAAGIHLIIATQTPRSKVVTGTIKANIPTRIALQVASPLDSRIILDRTGAENLVSKGDLLYLPPGTAQLERAQGAYISDDEVEALVDYWANNAEQQFLPTAQDSIESTGSSDLSDCPLDDPEEECYAQSLEVVLNEKKASASLLQRRLKIGFGKASRMIELLEKRGIITPSDGSAKPRSLLVDQ